MDIVLTKNIYFYLDHFFLNYKSHEVVLGVHIQHQFDIFKLLRYKNQDITTLYPTNCEYFKFIIQFNFVKISGLSSVLLWHPLSTNRD